MTKITWDTADRKYESGLDRGILYPVNGDPVPWNGLISVDESFDGGELTTASEDGITFVNYLSARNYKAVLRAFSSPKEFDVCVGLVEVVPGFVLTKQPRKMFNLSYRTLVGPNDYKIHIVYNALAVPTSRSYASTNDTIVPTNLEWAITAIPMLGKVGFVPTAHYVIDSTKVSAYGLKTLEEQLYGSDFVEPNLPSPTAMAEYLATVEPPIPPEAGEDVITDSIFDTFTGTGTPIGTDTVSDSIRGQV